MKASWAVVLTTALFAPSCAARAASSAVAQPASPALAQNAGDVVVQTAGSFALVGSIGFLWTATGAVVKRTPGPIAAGLQTAQRWGRISAGFTGGQAAGQVVRKTNDKWCNIAGAFFGGLAAATSLAEAPSSIATFVAFSYIIDMISPPGDAANSGSGGGEKISWKGKSVDEIRAEAEKRARADYAARHKDDSTRLKALR